MRKKKYYPETIRRFREIIKSNFPEAKPRKEKNRNTPNHLLWMLTKIEKEDFGSDKAGRWIGWISNALYTQRLIFGKELDELSKKDSSKTNV